MAWTVRGKSSTLLAPGVWRGSSSRKSVALTFDDGPSESTPVLLQLLEKHNVPATFFQCGVNVRRLPGIARQVARSGIHEIANHTENHPLLCFRTAQEIHAELQAAQESIEIATGLRPKWFRPPFGARWFGLRAALRATGLTNVMWSCIASDWRLPAAQIAKRLETNLSPGAIFCLHDGRETRANPDVGEMIKALETFIPSVQDRGFSFETVTGILSE